MSRWPKASIETETSPTRAATSQTTANPSFAVGEVADDLPGDVADEPGDWREEPVIFASGSANPFAEPFRLVD